MARHAVAMAVLLASLVLTAACGVLSGSSPQATGPLVTLETRGGNCPQTECGSTVVIERDGLAHETEPRPLILGTVAPEARAGLEQAIASTDFAALQATRVEDECPENFDGQEQIYTFGTAAGPVRLASCEVVIDPAHPLFLAVENAFASLATP
jgi:hypothetical protein